MHTLPHQTSYTATNFNQLVHLVVSCGGEHLKNFMETAGKNATYTSKVAVTEFVDAIDQWVQEVLLARIHHTSVFSLMADECIDISTVEELSIYCRWVEDGVPVEHFLDILPLKRTDAETIYSAIVSCLREKNIQLSKLVGMGFDGAATFSGKRSGVQMRLKTNAPHALFVHCHAIFFNLHMYKLQTMPVELSMYTQR